MAKKLLVLLLAAAALAACEENKPVTVDAGQPAVTVPPKSTENAGVGTLPPAMESFREADAALQAGSYDEALTRAEAATKADPNLILGWNVLGRAAAAKFQKTHDAASAKRAREAWGRALKLDPNFLPAWENLAALEEADGRPKEAADAWAKVLALAPDHPAKARIQAFIADAGSGPSK